MIDLVTLDFHGASLIARRGETPGPAMRPVVEGMGLAWQAQHRKIEAHPVLRKDITIMVTPSVGGPQEMVAFPLNRLNFWLATTHPNKVPDAAARGNDTASKAAAVRQTFTPIVASNRLFSPQNG